MLNSLKFYVFFWIDHFLLGQKNAQNFVGILEYGETPQILFEIYWPLVGM